MAVAKWMVGAETHGRSLGGKKWKQDFLIEQEVVIGTFDFCGGRGEGAACVWRDREGGR